MIGRYRHIEAIPGDAADWDVTVRGAGRLAAELAGHRDLALRFRDLATLRTNARLFDSVDDLRWSGPGPALFDLCARLGVPGFFKRVQALTDRSTNR